MLPKIDSFMQCYFHFEKTVSTIGCVLKESVCLLVVDSQTFLTFGSPFGDLKSFKFMAGIEGSMQRSIAFNLTLEQGLESFLFDVFGPKMMAKIDCVL